MFYSLFFYGNIDGIFKNIPVRNGGGGQIGKSTYGIVVACVRARTIGEGSNFFVILVRTYCLIHPLGFLLERGLAFS